MYQTVNINSLIDLRIREYILFSGIGQNPLKELNLKE